MSTKTRIKFAPELATLQEPGERASFGCAFAEVFGMAWDAVSGTVTGGATAGMVPGCGPANVWEREHLTVFDNRKGYGLIAPLLGGAAFFGLLWLVIKLA
jgi:hypothetical protein